MPKRRLTVLLISFLIVALVMPTYLSFVSSSTGNIIINSKSSSTDRQMQAGSNVNLYFGNVNWYSTSFVLFLSQDGQQQISSGDFVYSSRFSIYDLIDSVAHTYTQDNNVWTVGNYWVNGSIPSTLAVGNYYVKAFDENLQSVGVTDTYLIVNSIHYDSTLNISPPSGPGGVDVVFSGSQYPVGSAISISYYDPFLYTWNLLATTQANASGQIQVNSQVPDLKKSLKTGSFAETYDVISYRTTDATGIVYSSATYNQYLRGLKTVGNQTANGLYGNGTSFVSQVKAMVGDNIPITGKWFHPGIIYIRWDSPNIVGTVTSSEWSNAAIIGSTVANSNGTFATDVTIPTASAGEHYIAVEDSQTRIIVKIFVCLATLIPSPYSGPGGATIQFSGERYPPSTSVDIYYRDPSYGWSYWTSTPSDSDGKISFSLDMPDLRRAQSSGEYGNSSTLISFKTQVSGTQYAYADYYQFWRGLTQVGSKVARNLYGNGTSFASTVNVNPGDSLIIAGKWFHPGIIYVRFDGRNVVGTVTSSEWAQAQIIGTTTADSSGSFSTTAIIPSAYGGDHYLSIEDSETHLITKITILGPTGPTATPTPSSTTNSPTPTHKPLPNPYLLTPNIDVSCKGIATANSYKVTVNGNVILNGSALKDVPVLISYSINGGDTWQSLTLIKTQSDGTFAAVWNPDVNGNYLIKATVSATKQFNEATSAVTLALTPDQEHNVFTLNSNSTITQFAFDSTAKELSFIASGPSGSTGYVSVYIPKTLINDISTLKTYVDGKEVAFTSESQSDTWLITFNYSHSEHRVTMTIEDNSAKPVENSPQWIDNAILIAIVAIVVGVIVALIVAFKRTNKQKV